MPQTDKITVVIVTVATILITISLIISINFVLQADPTQTQLGFLARHQLQIEWGEKADARTASLRCEMNGSNLAFPTSLSMENLMMDNFIADFLEEKYIAALENRDDNCDNKFFIGVRRLVFHESDVSPLQDDAVLDPELSSNSLYSDSFDPSLCTIAQFPDQILKKTSVFPTLIPPEIDEPPDSINLYTVINCTLDFSWNCFLCQLQCNKSKCYRVVLNYNIFSHADATIDCQKRGGRLATVYHQSTLAEIEKDLRNASECYFAAIGNKFNQNLVSMDETDLSYDTERIYQSSGTPQIPVSVKKECVVVDTDKDYKWEFEDCLVKHCYFCF